MIEQQTKSETITLTATHEIGSIQHHVLRADQSVFIGSSSNCGFRLTGKGLSDIHCHVAIENGKLTVQDWMSAEGTRVNGELIATQSELEPGDVIQIGQHQISFAIASPKSSHQPVKIDIAGTSSPTDPGSTSDVIVKTPSSSTDNASPVVARDSVSSESFDFDDEFFDFVEEETYDRETVAMLQAEIDELKSAIAQRGAQRSCEQCDQRRHSGTDSPITDGGTDELLQRMQELIDEANRSDERVSILEEILHAAEDTNRSESEERKQLEAWVSDIENRIGQREDEHAAEVDMLRQRLEKSIQQQEGLQRQLRHAAASGNAPKHYEESLEQLQAINKSLQEELAQSTKERLALEQRVSQVASDQERDLREERANIAREHATLSRMRYEISSKLADVDDLPKTHNPLDTETSHRIQVLRQHLREIHEQEKAEEKEASLTTRLARLWKRVEY